MLSSPITLNSKFLRRKCSKSSFCLLLHQNPNGGSVRLLTKRYNMWIKCKRCCNCFPHWAFTQNLALLTFLTSKSGQICITIFIYKCVFLFLEAVLVGDSDGSIWVNQLNSFYGSSKFPFQKLKGVCLDLIIVLAWILSH